MNNSLSLTPLEQRVLQTFTDGGPNCGHSWGTVHESGNKIFGPGWTGHDLEHHGLRTIISATLGRLRSKGLLTRTESSFATVMGRSWGEWHLTSVGAELLGLEYNTDPY